jgi:hypothetical protein
MISDWPLLSPHQSVWQARSFGFRLSFFSSQQPQSGPPSLIKVSIEPEYLRPKDQHSVHYAQVK